MRDYSEKLFAVPEGTSQRPASTDDEVSRYIDSALEYAQSIGAQVLVEDVDTFTTADEVSQVLKNCTPTGAPDSSGWRGYYLKWIVNTLHFGEDLWPLLRKIARRDIPYSGAPLFASTSFFILQHRVTGKERAVFPPTTLGKIAEAALVKRHLRDGATDTKESGGQRATLSD